MQMMTGRHTFFKTMYGRILHVTHIDGLKGILESGFILPNTDGSRGYSVLGATPNCYVCQRLASVSLLDLKNAEKEELLDRFQNWLGIFTEHEPAIALEINPGPVEHRLNRFTGMEALSIGGLYIPEAEACYPDKIPISFIDRTLIIGRNYRIICTESSLVAAYKRARQVRNQSRRRRKSDLIELLLAVG